MVCKGIPGSNWRNLLSCLLLLGWNLACGASFTENDSMDTWMTRSQAELDQVFLHYESLAQPLVSEIRRLDARLLDSPPKRYRQWSRLWQQKQQLERQLMDLEAEKELQLLKVRYKKGLDLIKLLYEKILALDHHFSGMQIYQNILVLSNPNTYPDFQKTRNLLEEQLKKKNALQLPALLHTNPYLTAAFSLVATVVGEGEPKEKQKELEASSCILDFTVRMGAELSIIQHETEYLKKANQSLKEECERLFEDYVKVVGYLVPLEKCRISDDWETVYLELDEFVRTLETALPASGLDPTQKNRLTRERINLEFATQRVADFIGKYQLFVTQGTQYYQKFDNIISTYDNEAICKQDLPYQFEELQKDIRQTIDKFTNTYNLPEIQGSRMKDLLYGMVE
ncbi:MAG: hypothetical protein IPJ40_13895 [Saprospirales bacterium]|nr:hypothetical protein [Saprospirales bacterium]